MLLLEVSSCFLSTEAGRILSHLSTCFLGVCTGWESERHKAEVHNTCPCPVHVEVGVGAQAPEVFAHVGGDSTFQLRGQQLLCRRSGQIVFLGSGVMPSRFSGALREKMR